MRLLFVTPQLPWPPAQGTALRNFNLIRMASGVHEVDLLSLTAAPPERELPAPLRRLCRRIEIVRAPVRTPARRLVDLATGWADMERRLWTPALAARLAGMLSEGRYDAVQLEGFEVAGYLLGPAALHAEAVGRAPWPTPTTGRHAPWIIFDDHNAEYRLQESGARLRSLAPRRVVRAAYSRLQARRLRKREALYCAAADACLAVSDEDAAALEAICPGLGANVVPNGVDCDAMPPPRPAAQPTIFFSGKLDYRPNVDACEWLVEAILPLVRARIPEARLVIAGRDPAPAVRRLASPHVEITGPLEADALARRRAEAWVCAVPMRMGSGVRFKVIEAMAAGIPMVTTSLGAAGSGVIHGSHALIADSPGTFAGCVAELLARPDLRRRLAAASRYLAIAQHDWEYVRPRLLAVYARLEEGPIGRASVIATVRNEATSLPGLLASLAGQSRPPDEVVIADGGSTDGTLERLESAARAPVGTSTGLELRVVRAPGSNISRGRNQAITAARHDVIAATDAGVTLDPSWLQRLTGPLGRRPQLDGASGFFVSAPESTWERALGATTLPLVGEIDPARFLPSSRSIAFRREAWVRAGGYPEWLDYCEDLVFDLRLRTQGASLRFVPRAVVRFRPRPTPIAFFKQYYRYARGDGKAGLWPKRHAVRYTTYATSLALLWLSGRSSGARLPALAALLVGGAAYCWRPLVRLAQASGGLGEFARAAPLVPLVRVTGDVGKMLGYPAGLIWRLRHRPPIDTP